MAHQHLTGPVLPKEYPVHLTSSVKTNDINPGDLCSIVSGKVIPAASFTWDTDLATTLTAFAAAFAGIAAGKSDKDLPLDTRDEQILITQAGECIFDVASDTYAVGDLLTPVKAAGNALTNTLEITTTKALAVARVNEAGTTVTKIRGYLINTLATRGSFV